MNINLINKFEKDLGYPLSYVSEELFLKRFREKKLGEKYFTNIENINSILSYIEERNSNLKNFSTNLKIYIILRKSEIEIDSLFKNYKQDDRLGTIRELKNVILKREHPILTVSAALCFLIAFEDQDLLEAYEILRESIDSIIGEIEGLEITKESYSILCDLCDLLIQFSFYWDSRHELSFNIDRIDNSLERLHAFEIDVLENGKQPSLNIEPNELGLLDITKLRKES